MHHCPRFRLETVESREGRQQAQCHAARAETDLRIQVSGLPGRTLGQTRAALGALQTPSQCVFLPTPLQE